MKRLEIVMTFALAGCGALPVPVPAPEPAGEPAPGPAGEPAPEPVGEAEEAPDAELRAALVLVDYKRKGYLYAAKVEARRDADADIVYFDDSRETVGADQVLAFDWRAGTAVECDHGGTWLPAQIVEVGLWPPPATLAVADEGGEPRTVGLGDCRVKTEVALRAEEEQRRKEEEEVAARRAEIEAWHAAGTWFHEKNYKSFRTVKSLPRERIRGAALRKEIAAAASWWLSGFSWDEAAYVKIVGCRATSDWTKVGGEGARFADTVCVFEVADDVCIARYDACRQEYVGGGEYAACAYKQTDHQEPARIACGKAR